MEASLLLHGGWRNRWEGCRGGVGKPPPLEGGKARVSTVGLPQSYPVALRGCYRAIADDKDGSKNPMKFPVTSLFKNDSRGTVSGTRLGV